jgi:uncharacterized protein YqeY
MIIQQIKSNLLQARKTGIQSLIPFLSTLLAEIEKVGKDDGNRQTTDDEAIKILKKFLNNNIEFKNLAGDNPQLVFEREVLLQYIPTQLSEEQMRTLMVVNFPEVKKNQKGQVMKWFKENYSNRYDGKMLSSIFEQLSVV